MNLEELQGIVRQEIKQREEEGCSVGALRVEYKEIVEEQTLGREERLEDLLGRVEALEVPGTYVEPSTLEEIRAERPEGPRRIEKVFSYGDLLDRIYGAWLGRCAGCLLGKPVEGASKAEIRIAGELSTGYPLRNYFGAIANPPEEIARRNWSPSNTSLLEGMDGMARDDDTDYTIVGLRVLETAGLDFTTMDVANYWLAQLPFHKVYTAERIAYRNLVDGRRPPETATYRNPAREWIGAQIRADAFGYACPGWPEKAAEFAFRDAALSHVKNGIYGEMMVAAMIAAALVTQDVEEIMDIGLSEIPAKSRLAEAVGHVRAWAKEDRDWERTADRIAEMYGGLQGCHTITNAAMVMLGLLYGELRFEWSIATAVMPGFDTDCNGATVGSIVGAAMGAQALPAKWVAPLKDTIYSSIVEMPVGPISDLARRTAEVAQRVLKKRPSDMGL